MKEITLTIDLTTGQLETDLTGFQGKGCEAVIQGFAKASGAASVIISKKREFNAPSLEKKTIKQGN
jgi:hypothetical protein